eukprot:1821092-Pyramimonas_sp.AAC.1
MEQIDSDSLSPPLMPPSAEKFSRKAPELPVTASSRTTRMTPEDSCYYLALLFPELFGDKMFEAPPVFFSVT